MTQTKNVVDIIQMRRDGLSCREIAERLEVPEYDIWNVMRRTGNAGKFRAKQRKPATRRKPQSSMKRIEDVVERYGSLYIEAGAWAGYIATLDDTHTGDECMTTDEAIYSAIDRAEGKL